LNFRRQLGGNRGNFREAHKENFKLVANSLPGTGKLSILIFAMIALLSFDIKLSINNHFYFLFENAHSPRTNISVISI
jgi:hypothetical protein